MAEAEKEEEESRLPLLPQGERERIEKKKRLQIFPSFTSGDKERRAARRGEKREG